MREKSIEQYLEEMKQMQRKSRPASEVNTEAFKPVAVPAVAELPLDGEGSLIVVVNSAESRPLSGATVVVSDPSTGEVLYSLTTDESGKTSPVRLAAPLRDNSLAPGNGEIVYGLYNITASADNFLESRLENIPVFDSVVSIQQMRLLWLPAAGGITQSQNDDEGNPYTL